MQLRVHITGDVSNVHSQHITTRRTAHVYNPHCPQLLAYTVLNSLVCLLLV